MHRLLNYFLAIGLSSISCWSIADDLDGYPDNTFAEGGTEAFSIGASPNFAVGAREMADGRLVLVGNCANTCIARLHTDGSFDQSFGVTNSGTYEFTAFPTAEDYFEASAMALLPDGRIVVSGCIESSLGEHGAIAIVRSDGKGLDTSVGNGTGFAQAQEPPGQSSCYNELQIQGDGKFVVGGHYQVAGYGTVMQVTRFAANLSGADSTFGASGNAQVKFELRGPSNTSQDDAITALIIQPDGKIIVGGFGYGPSSYFVGEFARLLSNGQVDAGFGGAESGQYHTGTLAQYDFEVTSLTLDSFGRIVFGGSVGSSSGNTTMVGRLTPGGILDATFGGSGIVAPNINSPPQQIADVKITGGDIIAAGTSPSDDTANFAVWDFDFSGKLVRSFGGFGTGESIYVFESNSTNASPRSVLVTGRGLVVYGLSQYQTSSSVTDKLGIARLRFDHVFRNTFE
jgi:uncharacterized delta-60 repeat protein